MPAAAKTAKPSPRIGGEAVKAKTGQTWNEWFKILDAAGGKTMTQRSQIVMKRTPSLQRFNQLCPKSVSSEGLFVQTSFLPEKSVYLKGF